MFLLTPRKKRVQATRIAPSWQLQQEKQMSRCALKKPITVTVGRYIPHARLILDCSAFSPGSAKKFFQASTSLRHDDIPRRSALGSQAQAWSLHPTVWN